MSIELRRAPLSAWAELSAELNVSVSQTPAWLNFLAASQGAEPVLAEVLHGGQRAGMFVGAVIRRLGLRILGAPLAGWTSSYMGFVLQPGTDHAAAIAALRLFAFSELGCVHVEVLDRWAAEQDYGLQWSCRLLRGYEIDLRQSEDELFAAMSSACRRCIRKAEKSGMTIEVAEDSEKFAAEYYAQLLEVFGKQSLIPSYGETRVPQLIAALQPADMLLLLRARDAEGRCIATGIFPGHAQMMYFWGGASLLEHQQLRPNEALMWEAMRWWKARGAERFDMGGGGGYKAKYGGREIAVPWMRSSRGPLFAALRKGAETALRLKQRLR